MGNESDPFDEGESSEGSLSFHRVRHAEAYVGTAGPTGRPGAAR